MKKHPLTAPGKPIDKPLLADPSPAHQSASQPLAELILALSYPEFQAQDGVRRATAQARLVFMPAHPDRQAPDEHQPDQQKLSSTQSWRFIAPLGPIELDDLRWYLEDYAQWPGGVAVIQERAQRVQENLPEWGRWLYRAAFPTEHIANTLTDWNSALKRPAFSTSRRFSVLVDTTPKADAPETQAIPDIIAAREATALLLGLPWELLHDGGAYLFQGKDPIQVRRRLPPRMTNPDAAKGHETTFSDIATMAPPIRILLITARPEDKNCAYIDHRASALPLVAAMEKLPGLVEIKILHPPTFSALDEELERARRKAKPYHVVHFDGHGNVDPRRGTGILCFEDPEETGKLQYRRHNPIPADRLGALLKDHRIPLVFLDACRSAQANPAADPVHDRPTESVASALLQAGVGSVVAMNYSVLVETARRFVTAFYKMLAAGARVGDAMLAGQQALEKNKSRGRIFGGDELILHDWFVPVLYQTREDPRLFTDISPRRMPVSALREPHRQHSTPNDAVRPTGLTGILPDSLQERLGALPPEPETGFVGRSRELLALERLLGGSTASNDTVLPGKISAGRRPPAGGYAVILGQGGEGKTALATEFARWQVRSQQTQRAAFLSVEGIERNLVESVLDRLGHQLIQSGFSTQADCGGDIERATQKIEGALREQTTLLVLDNLESILPPPFLADDTPDVLAEENRAELDALLALCRRLLRTDGMGGTGILFTSREALPAPFDGKQNRQELHRLAIEDAVELVARVLNVADHAESGKAIAGEEMAIAQSHEAIAGPSVAIAEPTLAIAEPSVAIAGPPVAIAGERPATVNTSVATAEDRLAAANQPMAIAERRESMDGGQEAIAGRQKSIADSQVTTARSNLSAALDNTTREEIEQLVEAVHGHARTLSLLAPAIRARGVTATIESLVELMAEMEKKSPGNREKSLFAGVELSLRRLSPENRERARVLDLFHGGVQLGVLRAMMEWKKDDVDILAAELIVTGLATMNPYNHLTLHPALCLYLRVAGNDAAHTVGVPLVGALPVDAQDQNPDPDLDSRWTAAMRQYVDFLVQQQGQNTEMAATLTLLDLPNLFALLDRVRAVAKDHEQGPATIIDLANRLYSLLQNLGRPRLLRRVGTIRDAAARALGDSWNHAAFEAAQSRIEQQWAGGQFQAARAEAEALLERARAAGEAAYPEADYDLAMAFWLMARVLPTTGGAEQALPLIEETRWRFENIAEKQDDKAATKRAAEHMATACLAERGDCLRALGRLDEAAAAYEEAIRCAEAWDVERDVAVGKCNLGTVRKNQRRYPEALVAYKEARTRFDELGEENGVAIAWHQTGMVHEAMSHAEVAEAAYRESLVIKTRLGDVAGQADTLLQLGSLYQTLLDRPEEALGLCRQAAEKYVEIDDGAGEGAARNNLAEVLRQLGRLNDARREVQRALECGTPFSHAVQPWMTWGTLSEIERDAGNPAAEKAAWAEAVELYLTYRRDGGENHDVEGRIALDISQFLASGETDAAASLLHEQLAARSDADTSFQVYSRALQQIVAGNRDPALADAPALHYTMAAEIRLLLERLDGLK